MKWLKALIGSVHAPGLKRAMRLFYQIEEMLKRKMITKAEARQMLSDVVVIALGSAHDYALRLLPTPTIGSWVKTSSYSPYEYYPIKDTIAKEDIQRTQDLVHKAILYGTGASSVVNEAEQRYGSWTEAKTVVRTIILNEYTRNYLKQWKTAGLVHVKRVEMHDHKTCSMCRGLNGNIYRIDDLLAEEWPLTYCTHPSCRGSYTPYLGTYTDPKPAVPVFRNLKNNGNVAYKIAPEYAPWLSNLFRRIRLPYKVIGVYKKDDPFTTKLEDDKLYVNIPKLGDTDIREVVLRPLAEQYWDKYKDLFRKEYKPLLQLGLAHPQRQVQTDKEIFIDGFISFVLKQLDEPYEIWWWGKVVKL